MRASSHLIIGLILVVLGLLFLLENMGYLDAGEVIARFWPLILVIGGIAFLAKGRRLEAMSRPSPAHQAERLRAVSTSETLTTVNRSEIFGDILLKVSAQEFTGGSLSTVFGNIRLDLLNSQLREGEQFLRLSTVFGDSKIDTPAGMELSVQASTILGDIKIKGEKQSGFAPSAFYKTPGYDKASRRLRLSISQVFGDVRIY